MRENFVLIVLAAGFALAALYFLAGAPEASNGYQPELESEDNVTSFSFLLADTVEKKIKGLSGAGSLPENTVMLFSFERDNDCGIWMKDMKFSIDVIWLDSDFKVIDVAEDIKPNTYPQIFSPVAPCRYFIETESGFVKTHGISSDSKVFIDFEDLRLLFMLK